jgi:general secretion pathway protein G
MISPAFDNDDVRGAGVPELGADDGLVAATGALRSGQAGFTLLELLVVLGILAMLATFAAPQVQRYMGQARIETARTQLSALSTALELYALDNAGYPPQQLGLAALIQSPPGASRWRGPYIKKAEGLLDPWGRPYGYRLPGPSGGYQIFSLGRDNAPGGTGEDQDLVQQ